MLETLRAGGWLMGPILLCSVAAAAIVMERWWTLRRARVAPEGLLAELGRRLERDGTDPAKLRQLGAGSPLGQVLAAGLVQAGEGAESVRQAMQEAVSQASHELERHLTSLGIIASVTPLLGLLGTVLGMIEVFGVLMRNGGSDAQTLAGGISEALVTTAAGLAVAIPSLALHRYFLRRVEELRVHLEREGGRLAGLLERRRSALPAEA